MTDAFTDPLARRSHIPPRQPTSRLHAVDLCLGYNDHLVVAGLDLEVEDAAITAVIGPNGCGKSTLLRGLGRLLRPRGGAVYLDGELIHRLPTRQVARTVGALPQSPQAPAGLTVAELVSRGRHPHQAWYRRWSPADEAAVAEALRLTGMTPLADRPVDELSGGQRQRAWISMALAQGTDLLLLDEPTTHLDLAHQIDVLDLVEHLQTAMGRTVVMVLHDLNLAARYAQRLVAVADGAIVAQGSPREVLTEDLLREVFDLECTVISDPVAGTPLVVPIGSRHRARDSVPGDDIG